MRTPGPWTAYPNGSGARPYVVGAEDRLLIADCWTSDRSREDQASNARAIAALPAIIKAARETVRLHRPLHGKDCAPLFALESALRAAGEEC